MMSRVTSLSSVVGEHTYARIIYLLSRTENHALVIEPRSFELGTFLIGHPLRSCEPGQSHSPSGLLSTSTFDSEQVWWLCFAGDMFVKVRDRDEQGWCGGCINGRMGLYPDNYVEIVSQ